ncbi:MAG: hypothetical protein JNL11_09590 [Bdellovibrionaceae bacterium]|nr:hypothetical protein [Pseudobdellovibrionaceae bacterium]
MTTRKRISLLVTVTLLSSAVNAQQVGFRSAAKSGAQVTGQQQPGSVTSFVNTQKLSTLKTQMEAIPAFASVDPMAIDKLLSVYASNNTVRKVVDDAIRILKIDNDPKTIDIIQTRIEIMAGVSGMDISNSAIQSSLASDANIYAQYTMAALVSKIDAHTLSQEGKDRVLALYKELLVQMSTDSSGAASVVLSQALEAFNMNDGMSLSLTDIHHALSKNLLIDLFKGNNDVQSMDVVGADGSKITISVSPNEAKLIQEKAQIHFAKLMDLSSRPGDAQMNEKTGGIVRATNQTAADMFLKDNNLLQRSEAALSIGSKKNEGTLKSYDDLLASLKEYGSIIDGSETAGRASRLIKKGENIPLVGRVAGFMASKLDGYNNKELAKASLKKKIELTRQALNDGMMTIQSDNQTLNGLRAKAVQYSLDLEKEVARLAIIAGLIEQYIAELGSSNSAQVEAIKIHIGQRVQRELNSVIATLRILKNSCSQIDVTILAGLSVINQSDVLQREIIPIMAITESTHSAIAAQEAQIMRAKATKNLMEERLKSLAGAQEKALRQTAELAGTSVVDPKVLAEVEKRMSVARDKFAKEMAAAYDKLKQANAELIAGHNDGKHEVLNGGIANAVDGIVRSKGDNKK